MALMRFGNLLVDPKLVSAVSIRESQGCQVSVLCGDVIVTDENSARLLADHLAPAERPITLQIPHKRA